MRAGESRFDTVRRSIAWGRGLSLDVVAGGVAGGAFASYMTQARLPLAWWVVLGLAIWVVYTLDHLLDAVRSGPDASNLRHRLHAVHATPLLVAMAGLGAAAAVLAFTALPRLVLYAGVAVAGLTLVHLISVQVLPERVFHKEASIAFIYTIGIWSGPLLRASHWTSWTGLALALHGFAAFAYLLLYAWCESHHDRADLSASLARTWGERPVRVLAGAVATAVIVVAVVAAAISPHRLPFAVLAFVAVVPLIVLRVPALQHGERWRFAELALLALALPSFL